MAFEIALQEGPVALRPLRGEDAGLLLRWLTDRRVLEYWDGPSAVFTPQRIQEDFFEDEWNASRCIIQYEGKDIGYVQAYQLDGEMCKEYQYPHPELLAFGIDQFIAEPGLWGQGIGRRFIRLLLGFLEEQGAQAVVLDPHVDNPRAIRCYEACGFRKVKRLPKHEMHDGVLVDCWLRSEEHTSELQTPLIYS